MVALTTSGGIVSKSRKTIPDKAFCDFCGERFKRSRSDQRYCMPGCRRDASERRKEALIESLAAFLYEHSVALTTHAYGVEIEITQEQALAKASQCVESHHTQIKTSFMALGFVYIEREKRWIEQGSLRKIDSA